MEHNAFRELFLKQTFGEGIHGDPTLFYTAFEDGEDAMDSYFTHRWELLCNQKGQTMATQPFFPDIVPYVLEDTEDGFCALVTVTLPQTAAAEAMCGVVVFGSAMDPRVFCATPHKLKKGSAWHIEEIRANGRLEAVAVLYQGCDNNLSLFDAPTPQKKDFDTPLAPERREAALVETIVCWCMEHD